MDERNADEHAWAGGDGADPRGETDFDPGCWPRCNGADAPVASTSDAHERRCLVVLALYYRRNRWVAARSTTTSDATDDVEARIAEIEKTVERFEDRHAAVGFFGEPEFEAGVCRNVSFVRPSAPRMGPECRMESSSIAIPGLEEIPASELTGPARVVRWSHGKVDL